MVITSIRGLRLKVQAFQKIAARDGEADATVSTVSEGSTGRRVPAPVYTA